ncbi:hypothetical protein [Pedobacter sp.]
MKQLLSKLFIGLVLVLCFSACKKDEDENATVALEGSWKISKYDGQTLQSPAYGTFIATSTSSTQGNSNLVLSFNGTTTSKETASFVVSDNNTKVTFTKTDGNYTVLSGGGTWTINVVNSSSLKMTSQYGLVLEMTK